MAYYTYSHYYENHFFNTFAEVVKKYNDTKPVNGCTTPKELDVRPIAERRHKWQRIHKVSDTCYILTDGVYDYTNVMKRPNATVTVEQMFNSAPIVWRKLGNGRERITIRNKAPWNTTPQRKRFLERFLPKNLYLHTAHDKWYVVAGGEHYFLPWNVDATGPYFYAHKFIEEYKYRMSHKNYDDPQLEFERRGDKWVLIGKPHKEPVRRVNKERKAKVKPAIDAFYEWTMTMAPLLRNQEVNRYIAEREVWDGCPDKYPHGPHDWIREIVSDAEHPMYPALARWVLHAINYWGFERRCQPQEVNDYSKPMYEEDRHVHGGRRRMGFEKKIIPPLTEYQQQRERKRMRAAYNRFVNNYMGFAYITTK